MPKQTQPRGRGDRHPHYMSRSGPRPPTIDTPDLWAVGAIFARAKGRKNHIGQSRGGDRRICRTVKATCVPQPSVPTRGDVVTGALCRDREGSFASAREMPGRAPGRGGRQAATRTFNASRGTWCRSLEDRAKWLRGAGRPRRRDGRMDVIKLLRASYLGEARAEPAEASGQDPALPDHPARSHGTIVSDERICRRRVGSSDSDSVARRAGRGQDVSRRSVIQVPAGPVSRRRARGRPLQRGEISWMTAWLRH